MKTIICIRATKSPVDDLVDLQNETTVKWIDGRNPTYHSYIKGVEWYYLFGDIKSIDSLSPESEIYSTMRYSDEYYFNDSYYAHTMYKEASQHISFNSVREFIECCFMRNSDEAIECGNIDILF